MTGFNAGAVTTFFDLAAWRFFLAFYDGRLRRLLLYAALAALQSLLVLPLLALVRTAFDVAIPQGRIDRLLLIGAGILAIRLLDSAVTLWLRAAHIRIIKNAVARLREDILRRLYAFSRASLDRLDRSTTHARIVQDTERLDNMSNQLVSTLLPALFTGAALVVLLAFMNWFLLLVMISLTPLVALAAHLTGRAVKQRVHVFQRAFEQFANGVHFVLHHMDLTRIHAWEKGEMQRQAGHVRHLKETGRRMVLIYALHGQVQRTAAGVVGIVLLVIGGAAVANGAMTLGEFLSFWVAAGLVNTHVGTVTEAIPQIIAGNESMVTLRALARAGEPRPYRGRRRPAALGTIELDRVVFGYEGRPVIRGATMRLPAGSTLAIVGPSGSGKSTLASLMMGRYRPQDGSVKAGGVPYDELNMSHLRRFMGVVTQDPAFFPGTIHDNLVYGNPGIDRAAVLRASRVALADEFIGRLPNGYDTRIGDDGALLSGGEGQRLAIARALLHQPQLLILDEPTNHLDRDTVAGLMANLVHLAQRPTIVLISHDREVVRHVRQVYRIADGIVRCESPVGSSLAMERADGPCCRNDAWMWKPNPNRSR